MNNIISDEIVVQVTDMKVYFDIDKRKFARTGRKVVRAVDGVSFDLRKGEILSLVGESGSGKTTTGKAILQLVPVTSGEVKFNGAPVSKEKAMLKAFRQKAQMIYQDPYQSLNPRLNILDIIAEPLDVNHLAGTEKERMGKVCSALETAGLTPPEDFLYRYPYELSGGQRQRVVVAGAMIMDPDFIVADEPVSMLDASIRPSILKLKLEMRDNIGVSYLVITHDIALAWLISDRIAIMYLGKIMEIGPAEEIIKNGIHPYTRALTKIMPVPGVNKDKERIVLEGETPDASIEMTGCRFCGRCPVAMAECSEKEPEFKMAGPEHLVACHRFSEA